MALLKSHTFPITNTVVESAYHQVLRDEVEKFLQNIPLNIYQDANARKIIGRAAEPITIQTKDANGVSVVTKAHVDAVLDQLYAIAKLLPSYSGAIDA